ncbi:hypothetical protein ACTMTU_22945 [Streptomyces sp. OZ13]|uniref:hypothetical protein n=1 Tax=Streptomyces sp. OZ13 TaxID=3452210 RepID=UPI003F8B0C62
MPAPLRAYGRPADLTRMGPVPHGWKHYYWRSGEVAELRDDLTDVLVAHPAPVASRLSHTLVCRSGAIRPRA